MNTIHHSGKYNALEIIMTTRCNMRCHYCDYKFIKNKEDTSVKIIDKWLPIILKNSDLSEITLIGGEIGLLRDDVIHHALKIINDFYSNQRVRLIIPTNGELFNRIDIASLSNKYNNIDIIYLYHCVEDFTGDTVVDKLEYDNVLYIVTVTSRNIKFLYDFLKLNNDKKFTVSIMTDKNTVDGSNDLLLSKDQYRLLKNILFSCGCATAATLDKINNNLSLSDNQFDILRNICSVSGTQRAIDLVNEKIIKCRINYCDSPSIDLSEDNIIKYIKNWEYINGYNICKSCKDIIDPANLIYDFKHRLCNKLSIDNVDIDSILTASKRYSAPIMDIKSVPIIEKFKWNIR